MSGWAWPVPGHSRITSWFGPRPSPGGIGSTNHRGIDIAAPNGVPIVASRHGRVTQSGWAGGFGNMVSIDHGGGWSSHYAHNSQNLVRVGDVVRAGQRIALVGSTGNSTGPHLHFEARYHNIARNPVQPPVSLRFGNTAPSVPDAGTPPPPGNLPGGVSSAPAVPERKEITRVVAQSVSGTTGARRVSDLKTAESVLARGCELLIQNSHGSILMPNLSGEITLSYERTGAPGVLKFDVVNDDVLDFHEGNPVRFRVDDSNVFFGYVFKKARNSPGDVISVTCYDQIRYLKNKDTLVYANLMYSELLELIAENYHLATGEIEETEFVIERRIEEGTLLDMLNNAAELTVLNTGNLFVLFDDFGQLSLKNIESMRLPLLIDRDTTTDFRYTSSIDDETFNRVALASDNTASGEREMYIVNDEMNQSRWGMLQYYENVSGVTSEVLRERSELLLEYYNQKTRTLRLDKCFGDIRVRGGSSVAVYMELGDMSVQNYMVVERVKHTFSNNLHLMDLTVVGIRGEFVA